MPGHCTVHGLAVPQLLRHQLSDRVCPRTTLANITRAKSYHDSNACIEPQGHQAAHFEAIRSGINKKMRTSGVIIKCL